MSSEQWYEIIESHTGHCPIVGHYSQKNFHKFSYNLFTTTIFLYLMKLNDIQTSLDPC